MDTLNKKHIDTIDEVIEVLHTSGYNYTSLKNRLEQLKAEILEQQKRETQNSKQELYLFEPHEVEFRK